MILHRALQQICTKIYEEFSTSILIFIALTAKDFKQKRLYVH